MPEENIVDMAAKCRVLLLDIEGTTTSISFVKEKLFPYAEEHVQGFLEAEWEHEEVRAAVLALRTLALTDAEEKVEGAVALPAEDASKEDQIEGLVKNVKWQMSADRKAGPLKLLQGLIWKQGYDKGDIKGHVYEDVAAALEAWRADSRKIYVYSSGSEQAQKLLFAHSASGDLLPHLDGHFDTAIGSKLEADSYKSIAEKINSKPEEILFLTDIIKEAEAARMAGLKVGLVVRAGNAALPEDHTFPVISTLAELRPVAAAATPAVEESSAGTKRKQDQQEEQPAKVPKASLEDDVKSAPVETTQEESKPAETMEVDATPSIESVKDDEKVVIEEITKESSGATDATPVVAEPVAIEEPDEEMQTDEKTEVESKTEEPTKESEIETVEAVKETEKVTPEVPEEKMEAEESPPDVTEIEDVTDKKSEEGVETLSIEPVVEEPLDAVADAHMEVLQSVGELEKECDDLLSKVKDVTDLVQPPLPSISEEGAEDEKTKPELKEIDEIKMDAAEQAPTETEPAVEKTEIESEATEDTAKSKEEITKTKKETTETKEEITATKAEITETKREITETKKEITETKEEITETKAESTETKAEITKTKEEITETKEKTTTVSPKDNIEKPNKAEEKTVEVAESTEPDKIEPEKTHVNGDSETKETNGVKHNGDSNGQERLAENGDSAERVNGSNGEAKETAAEEDTGKATTEVSEIKVKSVADTSSEPEPVQQATDA